MASWSSWIILLPGCLLIPELQTFMNLELKNPGASNQGIPEKPSNHNLWLGAKMCSRPNAKRTSFDLKVVLAESIYNIFLLHHRKVIYQLSTCDLHVSFHDNLASLLRTLTQFFRADIEIEIHGRGGGPMAGRWRLLNIQVMS